MTSCPQVSPSSVICSSKALPTSNPERFSLFDDIAAAGVTGSWVTPSGIEKMPGNKGAYILALRLGRMVPVRLPGASAGQLPPGWYFYAGSARGSGGIWARLRRHFQQSKKLHWHIDQLSVNACDMAALTVDGGNECELVAMLLRSRKFEIALKGFGNTDCQVCQSHLLTTCTS